MNNTQSLKNAAAISSLMVLLAACGSGSSGGDTAPQSFKGSAVKGPVSAAAVTIDSDNDGVCGGPGDAPAVTTNNEGVFTFQGVTAEAHTVCVAGGTDTITGADLTGTTLTAPPSANPVVTPLTSLVDAQVRISGGNVRSSTDVAAAAGKIASTLGVTSSQVVPATPAAALTAEATANAVQALLAGTAKTVASVASGVTVADMYPAASRGAASAIANAPTTQGLTASTTLPIASETIRQAVLEAQAEPGVSTSLTALSSDLVSQVAAPALAAIAETMATATPANMQSAVASGNAKIDEMVAAMGQISSLMTTPAAGILIPANNAAVSELAAAVMSAATDGLPAAAASLETAANNVVNACVARGVPLNPIVVTWDGTIHGLFFSYPKVNDTPVTTTTQPNSVTVAGPLTSASMNVAINGSPQFSPKTAVTLRVSEVGGGRELWLFIDKVNMASSNGMLTVTVPATAKLYAYGKNKAGTAYSATLANAAANVFTSANNVITVNWSAAMNALAGQPGFNMLNSATGTFDVVMAMTGSAMYMDNATMISPVPVVALTAPLAAGFPNGGSFSGKGFALRVTVN